jgi:hypothetical protein
MRTNRIVRAAGTGSFEQGPSFLTSLLSILGIGVFGALLMPVSPLLSILALASMLLFAGMLLAFDTPQYGTYPMRGCDAMEQIYAELEQRRIQGFTSPFGDWLPLNRVLHEAAQADPELFAAEVRATITRL